MRGLFDSFCRTSTCFLEQETRQEVEVPAFFQIQQQINQLPTFESQFPHLGTPAPYSSHAYSSPNFPETSGTSLKRVKSSTNWQLRASRANDKENNGDIRSPKQSLPVRVESQQNREAPRVRIMYDRPSDCENSGNSGNSREGLELSRGQQGGHRQRRQQEKTEQQASAVRPLLTNPAVHRQPGEGVVSVQQFNRVVSMNMHLIRIMEQDGNRHGYADEYERPRPVADAGDGMMHSGRMQMIDQLEHKVQALRSQMGSRHHISPPHHISPRPLH